MHSLRTALGSSCATPADRVGICRPLSGATLTANPPGVAGKASSARECDVVICESDMSTLHFCKQLPGSRGPHADYFFRAPAVDFEVWNRTPPPLPRSCPEILLPTTTIAFRSMLVFCPDQFEHEPDMSQPANPDISAPALASHRVFTHRGAMISSLCGLQPPPRPLRRHSL